MNIWTLRRLINQVDLSIDALRYLLSCRVESPWLDYKESLNLETQKGLCNFTKDVLGLKNVGGGYLVIGVEDKTWDPKGLDQKIAFDSKEVRDKIRSCAGVDLDILIVNHDIQIAGKVRIFALILIRSSHKRNKLKNPTKVAKGFCPTEDFGIKRGDIYMRRVDSTIKIRTDVELNDLLDDLDAQVDHDALAAGEQPSPFAIEDGTYRLLEKGFEQFIGRDELKKKVMSAVMQDPRIWIINVHGPGGVGKTALVNWVVYEFYRIRSFEAIIHLTAKETILTDAGISRYPGRCLYSLDNLLDQILRVFDEPEIRDTELKKKSVIEILSAWKTLLVLDNMETVSDGRILDFVQHLPQDTKTKVLLTSRLKTGGWELPISVNELSVSEVAEFVKIKSHELNVDFPCEQDVAEKVKEVTGGLPLAIQWLIGQYKIVKKMDKVLGALGQKDSPILEFSFGNMWNILSDDAKSILATLTIYNDPPTLEKLAVAIKWPVEKIEKALGHLHEVALVTKNIQQSDGRVTYIALPITLQFARHQLDRMGDFEKQIRQRLQKFNEQMELQDSETYRFKTIFERYGMSTDNEKRAAMLCRKGESEMFAGNTEIADKLFRDAREIAPQSGYVYAMSASYELARNRIGLAIQYAKDACKIATKKTGALAYTILARVLDVQHDKRGRVDALAMAIEYESDNLVTRHQYGVSLSRAGMTEAAIRQFTIIIEKEKEKSPKTDTLLMALKTRIINYQRLGKTVEAKQDLSVAMQIIDENPHLQSHDIAFDDFENSW